MNVDNIIGTVQLLITAVGFYLLYRQIKLVNSSLQSDTQSNLYSQSAEVRRLLAQYPELRKYFFGGEDIEKNHDNYERTRTLAELYLNYFEHFIIQKENLRSEDWNAWVHTLTDIYDSSPIIRKTIDEKPKWYCKELRCFFSKHKNEKN